MIRQLTVLIGGDEYAIPLERVHEIVPSGEVTAVPGTPDFLLGLADLHGTAVPVVDLCRRFSARDRAAGEHRSVAVLEMSIRRTRCLVGIVIDGLGRVLRVDPALVQPPPPLDAVVSVEYITGVFEREGRFVLCLDVDRLLAADEAEHVALLAREGQDRPRAEPPAARKPYLCVRAGGERCALPLASLDEITPCGRIARVPGAPAFVLGATNVRGSILPVVDLGLRFHLAAAAPGGAGTLVITRPEDGQRVAMLVDAILGLHHVALAEIDATPPFGTRFPADVVEAMAPVAGEFVPVLDVGRAVAEHASSKA